VEQDVVIAGLQIGDRQGRHAPFDAVHAHERTRGLRLHLESARRRGVGQLEVLRHARAGLDGQRHHAGHPAAAELQNVRPRRHAEAGGGRPAFHAVDEHLEPGGIRLHEERGHRGRLRGGRGGEARGEQRAASQRGDQRGSRRGAPGQAAARCPVRPE